MEKDQKEYLLDRIGKATQHFRRIRDVEIEPLDIVKARRLIEKQ